MEESRKLVKFTEKALSSFSDKGIFTLQHQRISSLFCLYGEKEAGFNYKEEPLLFFVYTRSHFCDIKMRRPDNNHDVRGL